LVIVEVAAAGTIGTPGAVVDTFAADAGIIGTPGSDADAGGGVVVGEGDLSLKNKKYAPTPKPPAISINISKIIPMFDDPDSDIPLYYSTKIFLS